MTAIILSTCFCSILIINTTIKQWLEYRNTKHIKAHFDEVPKQFSSKITIEEHQKAQKYALAKIKASRLFSSLNFIIFIGWLLGGGLELIDTIARGFSYGPISTGLLFFLIYGVVSMILSLPESLYSTFVLEEKFGFNKTTPKIFIMDLVKGVIISLIIGLPILAAIIGLMIYLGDLWWAWAWMLLSLFQLFLLWVYPRLIAPLFNKFTPLEDGELKTKINDLLKKIGFASNGLFIMDASKRSKHGNAYFTGFGKNKRIVLFDTLVNSLSSAQVEAVLAHELGHFKKKHILKKICFSLFFSFAGFVILGFCYKWPIFFEAHAGAKPSAHMALLLFSMVSPVYTFLLTPISSYFSRRDEYEADRFAAEKSSASELSGALVQMYRDNASTLTPDPAYSSFYYSHPNALDRVKFLETLD